MLNIYIFLCRLLNLLLQVTRFVFVFFSTLLERKRSTNACARARLYWKKTVGELSEGTMGMKWRNYCAALHKQKAVGLVNELKDHLATLEDEKSELEAYQKLDKTKR